MIRLDWPQAGQITEIMAGEVPTGALFNRSCISGRHKHDLKNTTHHIKITPLVAGKPVEEYKGLSKYDSKKLVEANGGL